MKYLALLALPFLLVGCHLSNDCYHDHDNVYRCDVHHEPHHNTVVVSGGSGGGYNNNIIIIEEQPMFQCNWDHPYYHDPEWCDFEYGVTCCMWMDIGAEETWCYTDACGWQLSEINTYY